MSVHWRFVMQTAACVGAAAIVAQRRYDEPSAGGAAPHRRRRAGVVGARESARNSSIFDQDKDGSVT